MWIEAGLCPFALLVHPQLGFIIQRFPIPSGKRLIAKGTHCTSAQPITDCFYVDDILLLGAATQQEAAAFIENLTAFAAVSGQ